MFRLIIYWGSFLVFPFLIFISYQLHKSFIKENANLALKIFLVIIFIGCLLFIYARFIERYLVFTQTTEINIGFEAKIVVIADPHLGVFKGEKFLEKVVEKINKIEDVDAVLIPGDFTYYPTKNQNLEELFSPLQDLKVPAYGVLGNHDSEAPGPAIRNELKTALESQGVIFLYNSGTTIPNTEINILGLGDNWAKEDDLSQLENYQPENKLIVIAHNPDTTLNYTNNLPDLTVSGHTHGGQIRLPWIYKFVIPCEGPFDQGLYQTEKGQVFVTSGLGEVGLPLRFMIPPVIDILELK